MNYNRIPTSTLETVVVGMEKLSAFGLAQPLFFTIKGRDLPVATQLPFSPQQPRSVCVVVNTWCCLLLYLTSLCFERGEG